jgi:hypothetical protein
MKPSINISMYCSGCLVVGIHGSLVVGIGTAIMGAVS